MNNKLILAFLIVLLVIGVSFFIRMAPIDQSNLENANEVEDLENMNSQNLEDVSKVENQVPQESNSVSAEKLSEHNSASDCWIAYKGKVYDITPYLPRHPGSPEKIKPFCGTAEGFENAFTQKHGTSKVQMLLSVGTFIGDFDVVGDLN